MDFPPANVNMLQFALEYEAPLQLMSFNHRYFGNPQSGAHLPHLRRVARQWNWGAEPTSPGYIDFTFRVPDTTDITSAPQIYLFAALPNANSNDMERTSVTVRTGTVTFVAPIPAPYVAVAHQGASAARGTSCQPAGTIVRAVLPCGAVRYTTVFPNGMWLVPVNGVNLAPAQPLVQGDRIRAYHVIGGNLSPYGYNYVIGDRPLFSTMYFWESNNRQFGDITSGELVTFTINVENRGMPNVDANGVVVSINKLNFLDYSTINSNIAHTWISNGRIYFYLGTVASSSRTQIIFRLYALDSIAEANIINRNIHISLGSGPPAILEINFVPEVGSAPAPEGELYPEIEDYPEAEDYPGVGDHPEVENYPEAEDYPEMEDSPDTEEAPETEDYPVVESAPEGEAYPEVEVEQTYYPHAA